MKSLDYIPTNKIARAGNLVTTGIKLGGNYLKYFGKKALNVDGSRERLDEDNAKDIYNSLKTLKGSALKVAQILSMEKNLLPKAYVDQFSGGTNVDPPRKCGNIRDFKFCATLRMKFPMVGNVRTSSEIVLVILRGLQLPYR